MGFLDDLGGIVPDWAKGIFDFATTNPVGQGITTGIAKRMIDPTPIQPLIGPNGLLFSTGSPQLSPTQGGPLFPSGGGLDSSPDPFAILNGATNYKSIRAKMVSQLGFAPRRKTVMFMLRRMGADFTASALGLDQSDILWLYTHRRTSSRRHYVQTYAKWINRGHSAQRQLQHLCGKARVGTRRAPSKRRQPPQLRIVKVPVAK